MPMNWTPDNDRILLLKILETHNINVDTESIANAWPNDASTRPTGRAIKERIGRLRQMAGLKVSVKGGTPKGTMSTPRKPAPVARALKTPNSSGKKRSRIDNESDADDHITEDETPIKIKKELPEASISSSKVRSAMAGLRASMEDPFQQKLSQPVFRASVQPIENESVIASASSLTGGTQEFRARSARQASQQASDALRRASEDTDSSEDSQVSTYEQNELEI
ncbi:hypothetical protein DM02DRAFT_629652 [Periconia macrospinosa]|uniref:Uncharacterized protein n=1 Tax=Periconia macrospinosa TaxID=97972 RepID=A0A2V1DN93_9PLEO|nr:hypothetical protein DM02DRAFT_629652 [Periconia macrospinosa]